MSNHPDFVGIIPILLENPESRRNFGRDRKIPILNPRIRKLFSSNKQGNEILDLDLRKSQGKVWTKKIANKIPLPSVSGSIAFMQGLLRLVTSHAFRTIDKYQAWKRAWNDDQFPESFLIEIFIWECWQWCFRVSRSQKFPNIFPKIRLSTDRRGTVEVLMQTKYCPKVGHCYNTLVR